MVDISMVGQVYKPTNKSVVEKDALRTVILQTYLVGVHHVPKAFKVAYKKMREACWKDHGKKK